MKRTYTVEEIAAMYGMTVTAVISTLEELMYGFDPRFDVDIPAHYVEEMLQYEPEYRAPSSMDLFDELTFF